MKLLLTLSLVCLQFIVTAQTKIIAHKSHSGSSADFEIAYADGLFDMEFSGFGDMRGSYIRTLELDSVLFINDSACILVTNEYYEGSDGEKIRAFRGNDGRDTLFHHPLLSHRHALDSIKKNLKHHFNFRNHVDSVRFIGFDNEKPLPPVPEEEEDPTEAAIPVIIPDQPTDSSMDQPDAVNIPGRTLTPMVLLFSLLCGIVVWLASRYASSLKPV